MNEERRSSDSDLQNEVGATNVPDRNQNQCPIRMLEEEEVQGVHAHLHHNLHHDSTNNNTAGEEEEEEEEELESTSGACSPEPIRNSSSLSCSPSGPLTPEEIPVGVFSPCDLSRWLSETLSVFEERGDDAALPHRLHQIAECLLLERDYERALHFLQLERLYHERVLSNITTLQETWVSRWRRSQSEENSLPHCDLNSAHLDKLKHICMTHRQPSWSADACELVHRISVNGESCGEKNITSESLCSNTLEMLEQVDVPPSESGPTCLPQQNQPTHLCDPASDPPTASPQATPTAVVTESSVAAPIGEEAEKEPKMEKMPEEVGKEAEPGRGRKKVEPVESDPNTEAVIKEGGAKEVSPTELNGGAGKQEEEVEEAVEALELEEELQTPEDVMLDLLAKRIQVEEITPASGLVSILKKRECGGGDDTNKPLTKRRVRFHFPEDALEQDEVGGDSWLLLVLLCLVTVVISVGGTAVYCAFGDAQSSVCTDFSHNIDFYMGKVQRGVDDITHFFSSFSS